MRLVAKYQTLEHEVLSTSNDIQFLEAQVKDTQYKLNRLAGEQNVLDEKKYTLTVELCERKEALYAAKNKNIKVIAHEAIDYLNSIGLLHTFGSVYERIPNKYKQDNIKQLKKLYGSPKGEQEDLNLSVEEKVLDKVKSALEEAEVLPSARKKKLIKQVEEETKKHDVEKGKVKEGDFGIHQNVPPEDMQGPSAFSEAIHATAEQFRLLASCMDKIEQEVMVYKPVNAERIQEKADDWNTCINDTILGKIIIPMFVSETRAERDRKWTTSTFHWIKIIKNRIEQSKHGAGKMAEGVIVDAFGNTVYNKKNKPIKKSISRERVSDTEWAIVDLAEQLIAANTGMIQLHDWLENDQGGHRRYRKEFISDYFSEASMGSIKSGNDEYEQFMRDYKKRQLEKFRSVDKWKLN